MNILLKLWVLFLDILLDHFTEGNYRLHLAGIPETFIDFDQVKGTAEAIRKALEINTARGIASEIGELPDDQKMEAINFRLQKIVTEDEGGGGGTDGVPMTMDQLADIVAKLNKWHSDVGARDEMFADLAAKIPVRADVAVAFTVLQKLHRAVQNVTSQLEGEVG